MPWTQGKGVVQLAKTTVTNKSIATNVAALTVGAGHPFVIGDPIWVAINDPVFDGAYVVSATTATTVSYAKTNANVASTAATGTVGLYFSPELTQVEFEFTKETLTIKPTFATDDEDYESGAIERNLTLGFYAAFSANSLHERLRSTFEGTGEVTFDALLEGSVVGTNNPRRTGTIIINSLSTGGQVAALREQSKTYRIKPGTYQKGNV